LAWYEPHFSRAPVNLRIVLAGWDLNADVFAGSLECLLVGLPPLVVRCNRGLGDFRCALHACAHARQAAELAGLEAWGLRGVLRFFDMAVFDNCFHQIPFAWQRASSWRKAPQSIADILA
jgi:hypothetical protein